MINKVLIKIIVPELDSEFDLFIPTNELIWKIEKLIVKAISDLSGGSLNIDANYILLNKLTNKVYEANNVVVNTDIRNATEIVLLTVKAVNPL